MPCQIHQFGIGPAAIEPGESVGRVAHCRITQDLAGSGAQKGRLAGEDLAEDRAQSENIGTLVHLVYLAGACSGAM